MVCRLASRTRCRVLYVTLNTIVANTTDSNLTTRHLEELCTVDAVACGLGDVDGGILQGHVFARLDAVLHITYYIKGSLLCKFCMSLDIQTTLLRTTDSIRQRVDSTVAHLHLDALAVLDVYSRTALHRRRIRQRQSVQLNGSLVTARHIELAICRFTTQRIGHLLCEVVALGNADVCTADHRRQVLCHIACNSHLRHRAVIADCHLIVCHLALVNHHTRNVADGEHLAHNGQRRSIAVGHIPRLCSRELVRHVTHLHIQRLSPCDYRQQQGYYHHANLLHFTATLNVPLPPFIT